MVLWHTSEPKLLVNVGLNSCILNVIPCVPVVGPNTPPPRLTTDEAGVEVLNAEIIDKFALGSMLDSLNFDVLSIVWEQGPAGFESGGFEPTLTLHEERVFAALGSRRPVGTNRTNADESLDRRRATPEPRRSARTSPRLASTAIRQRCRVLSGSTDTEFFDSLQGQFAVLAANQQRRPSGEAADSRPFGNPTFKRPRSGQPEFGNR
jgi:hypothetical protein